MIFQYFPNLYVTICYILCCLDVLPSADQSSSRRNTDIFESKWHSYYIFAVPISTEQKPCFCRGQISVRLWLSAIGSYFNYCWNSSVTFFSNVVHTTLHFLLYFCRVFQTFGLSIYYIYSTFLHFKEIHVVLIYCGFQTISIHRILASTIWALKRSLNRFLHAMHVVVVLVNQEGSLKSMFAVLAFERFLLVDLHWINGKELASAETDFCTVTRISNFTDWWIRNSSKNVFFVHTN